jgi:hypothetical protein
MNKITLNTLLLALLSLSAFAQKLPGTQETSVWAPANIKVDGKTTEWNDTYQALNKTTNVYYTVANDKDNLYLVIKSTDQMNNNKIIGGGVNLTINTANKKTDKDAFVLIFPVVNLANLRNTMMQGMRSGTPGQAPDSAAIAGMRKKVVSTFKEIKLIGFKDIPDSVISVYNEYGIKGYVDFDNKGALIIEMAVPLKAMNITAGTPFAYNVKLNGINISAMMSRAMPDGGGPPPGGGDAVRVAGAQTVVVTGSPMGGGGMASFGTSGGGGGGMPRGMGDIMGMLSPTDFWGKYTLAKK